MKNAAALFIILCWTSYMVTAGADTRTETNPALEDAVSAFEALKSASAAKGGVRRGSKLSEHERKANRDLAQDSVSVYRQAMDFMQRYPGSTNYHFARHIGMRELGTAVEGGDAGMRPVLEKWVGEIKNDPSVPIETKIEFKWTLIAALNPDRGAGLEKKGVSP